VSRDPARVRLTRRGRGVVAVTVALVPVALLAGGRVLTALSVAPDPAGAVVSATPTVAPTAVPAPPPPRWRPAVPTALRGGLPAVTGRDLVAAAPVVVAADLTDRLDRDVATWLALRLRAPLQHVPRHGERLLLPAGTELVVAVGGIEAALATGATVRAVSRTAGTPATAAVALGADPRQLHRATVLATRPDPPVAIDRAAVADLLDQATPGGDTGATLLLRPRGATAADVVTALALGHRVVATVATDPRGDRGLVTALAGGRGDGAVALLGSGWADVDVEAWRWQLDVVRTGVELPGGGQLLFPQRRLVALYGHPAGPALGALGEQPVDAAVVRAQELAAAYGDLVDEPVVPALELIATVASASPGARGGYSRWTPVDELRPWVAAAAAAGLYVVLDLQPGRTHFLEQARAYEELLREPHVGLALDPEWRLGPTQRHLRQVGSVSGREVNEVATWLADLTRTHALPQKLLIVHQFTPAMVRGREVIDTARPELAMLVQMDGQGSQGAKLATYDRITRDAPEGLWWGWKNFYDEDHVLRTPADTVAVDPSPWFVSYQ
jgi:hypothetical protein